MSSSLLFSYPQLTVIPGAGILGLAAYSFATVVPLWGFAWFGPLIRRLCPDGFTLAEFIRRRYGWPVGVLTAVIFVAFMFCFMLVELNTYGSVVSLIGGVDATIAALIVAISTTIYTAYGGFKASLWTDNVNAVIILIEITVAAIAVGVNIDIDPAIVQSSQVLEANSIGGQLWYILPVSLIFSQFFNQGFWQRAFASKDDKALYWSIGIATVPLFAVCFLVGMTGALAWWAGLFNGVTDEDDGSLNFFYILATLPNWVQGFVLVLSSALTSSAYDTFQSAQISTIYNDVFLGRLNIWICRAILVGINVPSVILAVKNIDILTVFLIADIGAAAILPGALLGLSPKLYFLNGFDVFCGGVGGFLTVFIFGTIFYGNAYQGISLIVLPEGLYTTDYSTLGAFFAAPLGSLGWTFAAFGARYVATLLYCKMGPGDWYYHNPLRFRTFDTSTFALDPDRPISRFHAFFKGSGNPDDGHRLDGRDDLSSVGQLDSTDDKDEVEEQKAYPSYSEPHSQQQQQPAYLHDDQLAGQREEAAPALTTTHNPQDNVGVAR
jgi:Na+/proline symporter